MASDAKHASSVEPTRSLSELSERSVEPTRSLSERSVEPTRSRRHIRRLRPLTVGAIAVAHSRANAVGPLRLSCEADALRIELMGIGRYAPGFAFTGLGQALTFSVPYTAVRALVREGPCLHLALDPAVAAPYNRFALSRFSRAPLGALLQAHRLRSLAVLLRWLVPLPLGILLAWNLSPSLVQGDVGRGALALVVAWLAHRALDKLVGWLTWGGPDADRLRAAVEHTIAARLGLEPAAELVEEPAVLVARPLASVPPPSARHTPRDEVLRPPLGQVLGQVLRPVAFAALGILAVVSFGYALRTVQRFGVVAHVVLPIDDAVSGIAPAGRSLASAAVRAGTPEGEPCACQRVHAGLWSEGLPRLSIVIEPVFGDVDSLWLEPEKHYPVALASDRDVEFDLAVINNGDRPIDAVDLVVTFARRDDRGRRRNLIERGLSWPHALRPAQAVKWRVKAEGGEFKIDTRHRDRLPADAALAAADGFRSLSEARLSSVKVHGAMMLSLLRDPKALDFARSLKGLTRLEERALEQILATLEPLAVCDSARTSDGVEACLYNGTDQLLRALDVTELGAKNKPRRWQVRDLFAPKKGLKVRLPTGSDVPPAFRVTPSK
jgi:hypothetical protein